MNEYANVSPPLIATDTHSSTDLFIMSFSVFFVVFSVQYYKGLFQPIILFINGWNYPIFFRWTIIQIVKVTQWLSC